MISARSEAGKEAHRIMRPARPSRGLLGLWAAVTAAALATSSPLSAQSVLDRPPNMHGTWVGSSGTVQFNVMHRFAAGDPPERAVRNTPTFLVATGVPGNGLAGARYATSSPWIRGFPNEWEFFVRYTPMAELDERSFDLSLTGAYNQAADSFDGQITLARRIGPLRVLTAGRAFSQAFREGEARSAIAAGANLRLSHSTALAADLATLLDRGPGERMAWSAGLQIQIPTTPHTLSIHASNAHTTTLQGSSIGGATTLWGFEFTIPVTLSRYIGTGPSPPSDPESGPEPSLVGEDRLFDVEIEDLAFAPEAIQIQAGDMVRWTNTSLLIHTVTAHPDRVADPSRVLLPEGVEPFDSGDLAPGESFTQVFPVPGEYIYLCIPHQAIGMIGRIIVTE